MSVPTQIAFSVNSTGDTLKVFSAGARVGDVPIQEPYQTDTYLRPDGVSNYFQPNGTSLYLQPLN